MRHYGLIGKTLSHSFSANFFRVKFENEGIDADYTLIEIDDISTIRNIVVERELSGFNVTIPYKQSIIPYLDDLSDEAKAVGAVNCVVVRGDRLIGYNTDITGIEASFEWLDIDIDTRALILGTGGASKAVQYVCKKYNIAYDVVSRDAERGDYTYDMLNADIVAQHRLIINTTPVGMSPNNDDAPVLPYDALGAKHRVFDLIYNPATTLLLSHAKAQDASTMNGILMLQTQAIASWHIWQRAYEEFKRDNIC
ncbi:MAG: shikimate dehydrogenase [Alistipes sp.]|nr:shikimate dehydrogenase [Alistipes sp.]MBO7263034.1 shikimate dehydrogenase [Alistipes sp.]